MKDRNKIDQLDLSKAHMISEDIKKRNIMKI